MHRTTAPFKYLPALLVLAAAWTSESAAYAGVSIPGIQSGSRLRAMFHSGGDGALLFHGWFDRELGFRCQFMRSPDGPMRCMPSGQPAAFFDSTCTAPVWGTACPAAPPPRYVAAMVVGGATAYALGDPYNGVLRHNKNWGYCGDEVRGSGPFGWQWSYYGVGAEIPSDRLASGSISNVPIGNGAFYVHTFHGDDGSSSIAVEVNGQVVREPPWRLPPETFVYPGTGRLRVPSYDVGDGQIVPAAIASFFDTQADAFCQVEEFADGLRCVPRNVRRASARPAVCSQVMTGPDSQWAPVSEGME